MVYFILYGCAISSLVYCRTKKSQTSSDDKKGDVGKPANKASGNGLAPDKTQIGNTKDEAPEAVNKNEDEKKFKTDKTEADERSAEDNKAAEKNGKPNKAKARTKTRTRTKTDESWKWKRKSREAKTQCPEKSMSEEMDSAIRSTIEQERRMKREKRLKVERTQNPEKSLMEEMNAALASDAVGAGTPGKGAAKKELQLDATERSGDDDLNDAKKQ